MSVGSIGMGTRRRLSDFRKPGSSKSRYGYHSKLSSNSSNIMAGVATRVVVVLLALASIGAITLKVGYNKNILPSFGGKPGAPKWQEEKRRLEHQLEDMEQQRKTDRKDMERTMRRKYEHQLANQKRNLEKEYHERLLAASKDETDYPAEIQKFSKRQVIEQFGEGPHYVEFQVVVPRVTEEDSHEDEKEPQGDHKTFVVEMASLELMPHSVYLFLNQVTEGLLDGSHFHVNAPHVLLASPIDGHGNHNLEEFEEKMLDHLGFQEYSADYPHSKYTLGYAGKPQAGPDFYINKMDNTIVHGPNAVNGADPCFARVVKGVDVLDQMTTLPVLEEEDTDHGHPVLLHPVLIESVHVLHDYHL